MMALAKENLLLSKDVIFTGDKKLSSIIAENEKVLGSYFHVLNDVERIGDHAENFYEIGEQMSDKELAFSNVAVNEITNMFDAVIKTFDVAIDVFNNLSINRLEELNENENVVDGLKKSLNQAHVQRLANGCCKTELSAYFFSTVSGLERVADHLVNVGYSTVNPTGSQNA